MKLYLQVTLPDRDPETRDFGDVSQLIIGRSEQCDFSLPLMNDLSRQHAKLEVINGRWHVSDLGSKFGTFVNEAQIEQPTEVTSKDIVRLGGHVNLGVFDERSFQQLQENRRPRTPVEEPILAEPVSGTVQPAVGQFAGNIGQSEISKTPIIRVADDTGARPWHIGLGILTAVVSALLLIWYLIFTHDQPKRGYTFLGMTTGIIGSIILGIVGFYAARKRVLQELIPWRLLTWLRWHLWLSVIGFWMILIHAGFHLDGGSGTWAMLFLLAAVGTGIVGWYQYKKVPGQVISTVGNLATGNVQKQIDGLDRQISDQLAGREKNIVNRIQNALNLVDSGERTAANISWDLVFENPTGEPFVDEVRTLVQRRYSLESHLGQQQTLHKSMRWWLWLHIPAAILFGVLLAYHIYDAGEIGYLTGIDKAGPHEFADPTSCIQCHQAQYDDWIGSMHAIAMSSPVTELQNYLVVKKDRVDDGIHGVVVGDLCIKCHAPTSVEGYFWEKEDLLATVEERAPSSQFGVSCVACHQIGSIAKSELFPGDQNPKFQNAANMELVPGKAMIGPHGRSTPIAGNSAHRGEFGAHFDDDASFCATCHTVQVPVNGGEKVVTLQNTYEEWLDGSVPDKPNSRTVSINWSERGVNCIDCHGKPLKDLARKAFAWDGDPGKENDIDLHVEDMIKAIVANAKSDLPDRRLVANPADGFDRPLSSDPEDRPRHLHTFVGVDYHLEPDLPYVKGHPFNDPQAAIAAGVKPNAEIQEDTIELVDQLLKIAAAIKITNATDDQITVEVANLGTGHHLPAGFAFAREMWIEVSVDGRVVAGGRNGDPLKPNEKLDKYGEGKAGKLVNFQAVLWNGDDGAESSDGRRHGETVLQNECVNVLKGPDAVEKGFFDRHKFLEPGEIRTIDINVDSKNAKLIKVRLRFRNYPPEFLQQLAHRFRRDDSRYKLGPNCHNEWEQDDERADRIWHRNRANDGSRPSGSKFRDLVDGLHIFDMAEDTVRVN